MPAFASLPAIQLFLCLVDFILHMIALPSNYWAFFDSKTELGIPEEHGNYGLWGLCTAKTPHFKPDCDPLDTFFKPPPHIWSARIMAILYAVALGIFIPFAALRLRQIKYLQTRPRIKPKTIGFIKLTVSIIAMIFAGMILLFATVRDTFADQSFLHEMTPRNFEESIGWAFWLQVAATGVNLIVTLLCLIEIILIIKSESDSIRNFGSNSEFGANLNPSTAFINPFFTSLPRTNGLSDGTSTTSNPVHGWAGCNSTNCQLQDKLFPILNICTTSYQNPTFSDDSPDLRGERRQFLVNNCTMQATNSIL